jgi:putative phosphoribosyl transferase
MIFKDRQSAGMKLAEKLFAYQSDPNAIIIGLPRGGVIVAAEIAQKLNLPLDIVVTRKIGSPISPELAIGAISESGTVILDQNVINSIGGVDKNFIEKQVETEKKETERRLTLYRAGRTPLDLKDKTVIIVDDGIATGATMRAAVKSVKEKGAIKVILVIPVAPKDILEVLSQDVDKVVCLTTPDVFYAIGTFYKNFPQIQDDQVVKALEASV